MDVGTEHPIGVRIWLQLLKTSKVNHWHGDGLILVRFIKKQSEVRGIAHSDDCFHWSQMGAQTPATGPRK